jgi:DNA-binding CsgD family transcriptional regulator
VDKAGKEQILTTKEALYLREFAQSGLTATEIAKKYFRSPRTVEGAIQNAKTRLQLKSRAEIAEVLATSLPL